MANYRKVPSIRAGSFEISELRGGRDFSLELFRAGDGAVFLFDLGEWPARGIRRLSHVSNVFVSHAHIDHFISFDRLIRFSLGLKSTVTLWGPEGFLERIEARLAGYTWNIVELSELCVKAVEISETGMRSRVFRSWKRFVPDEQIHHEPFGAASESGLMKVLLSDPCSEVSCVILDHRVPSLAFRVSELAGWTADKNAIAALGLMPGPWLGDLKARACAQGELPHSFDTGERKLTLDEIARILSPTRPVSVAYITDTVFSPTVLEKAVELACDADLLYCEASYLQQEEHRARENYHLTAPQAGLIARKARVSELIIFHMANIYRDRDTCFVAQAQEAAGSIPVRVGGKVQNRRG